MPIEDIDKHYVSPYDRFLRDFDQKNPKTASQKKEIEKNRWIAERRDSCVKDGVE